MFSPRYTNSWWGACLTWSYQLVSRSLGIDSTISQCFSRFRWWSWGSSQGAPIYIRAQAYWRRWWDCPVCTRGRSLLLYRRSDWDVKWYRFLRPEFGLDISGFVARVVSQLWKSCWVCGNIVWISWAVWLTLFADEIFQGIRINGAFYIDGKIEFFGLLNSELHGLCDIQQRWMLPVGETHSDVGSKFVKPRLHNFQYHWRHAGYVTSREFAHLSYK